MTLSNKDFLVRTHELDTFSVYSPDSVYSCSYIDDGERLYESEQYDKVQKYYSIDNCNVPWAKAYLGACSWKLALNDYDVAECELEKLKKTTDINGHDIANTISYHLEMFEKEGKKAIEFFELYLQSEDKKYISRIEEIKYDLIQLLEKSVVLRNSIPHELEAYKYRRDTYLEEERNEMIRKDNERRFQQEQQRLYNQKLHEINERNRIAFELERKKRAEARRRAEAKRRVDEKRKEEQKKKESNHTNINSIKLNR